MRYANRTAGLVLACLCALGGCSGEDFQGECKRNADCPDPAHMVCGDLNQCLCTSDLACAEDEYCNAEGYCQTFQGCLEDADCGDPADFRCDTSTGRGICKCRTDAACETGEFCNTSGSCQQKAGCVIDSDCGETGWRCWVNPETDIGECLCLTDEACQEAEFCNPHGYCQPMTVCTSDDDCPVSGTICDTQTGECLCDFEHQSGCEDEEVCNSSGYCQPRPGCYDNSDCEHLADHFCDITTRSCQPVGYCGSDRQCPLGQVCRQNQCIDGCNDNEDCMLDQRCVNYQCEAGCQADEFCDFMEYCSNGNCQGAYTAQTPYCKPCDNVTEECGNPTNRCLIYPYEDDPFGQVSDEYCAVECTAGQQCSVDGDCPADQPCISGFCQRCPNGFGCFSIRVVDPADQCWSDADCPNGAPCLGSVEEDKAYCACNDQTNPCPMDMCNWMTGLCINKKTPCTTSADCVIACEKYEGENYGGCTIGRNCGLLEGYHCDPP